VERSAGRAAQTRTARPKSPRCRSARSSALGYQIPAGAPTAPAATAARPGSCAGAAAPCRGAASGGCRAVAQHAGQVAGVQLGYFGSPGVGVRGNTLHKVVAIGQVQVGIEINIGRGAFDT
nr:hypothetical protein [Tanacetum cinerariifolium]